MENHALLTYGVVSLTALASAVFFPFMNLFMYGHEKKSKKGRSRRWRECRKKSCRTRFNANEHTKARACRGRYCDAASCQMLSQAVHSMNCSHAGVAELRNNAGCGGSGEGERVPCSNLLKHTVQSRTYVSLKLDLTCLAFSGSGYDFALPLAGSFFFFAVSIIIETLSGCNYPR